MAKVTVVYDDLKSSADNLAKVKSYIDKVSAQITSIKARVESLGAPHDNCYAKTLDSLDDLDKAFKNYGMEIEFLANQCTAAYNAFKDAENDSTKMSEAMKQLITDMGTMLGVSDSLKLDDVELNIHKDRSDLDDKFTRSTVAKRSETWSNIFEDSNADGLYDKINGKTVTSSTSIQDDSDKQIGETDNTTGTTGGGGGGGTSGGGGGTRVKYTPDDDSKKKKEDSKQDDKKKEDEKKQEEKKEDPVEEKTPEEEKKPEEEQKPEEEKKPEEEQKPEEEKKPEEEQKPEEEKKPSGGGDSSQNEPVTYHTGGGYSEGDGYVPYTPEESTTPEESSSNKNEGALVGEELEEDVAGEIDTIVKGDEVTKIPVSHDPISTKESSGGSSVIPIAAGLSAAAAAGLGAKAYMDHKRNNSDDDVEEFESEEWDGDESTDFEYEDSSNKQEYLDDDDYIAHENNIETEKYGARNNEELADLQ